MKRTNLALYNGTLILGALALFGLFFFLNRERPNFLVLGAAAVSLGAFFGFLFSAYGDERKTLSPLVAAAHGIVGGITITDLSRKDSLIKHTIHILGTSVGLDPGKHGLVLAIGVTFFPMGFFFVYINRKLAFNEEADVVEKRMAKAEATLAQADARVEAKLEQPAKPGVELLHAAKDFLKRPDKGVSDSFDDLFNEAKSHFLLGHNLEAVRDFKKCLKQRPLHTESLLYIAAASGRLTNYKEAIPYLEKLVSLEGAPDEAWRMLGYCYLFCSPDDPNYRANLHKAIDATNRYLATHPNDPGAKLNLACAYGQLGPDDPTNVKQLKDILVALVDESEEARSLLKNLARPEMDFEQWIGLQWFRDLVGLK